MTLAPTSAPPPVYAPRRGCGSGCLWGCLLAALLMSLPFVLAGGYGAWFWNQGYKRDPVLRVVGEMVREDGLARQVLGPDAVITGVDGNYFSWMPGMARNGYEIALQGPKGNGHLAVTSHTGADGPKLDSAILTGPDGRHYDLLKHMALPGDGVPDNSI